MRLRCVPQVPLPVRRPHRGAGAGWIARAGAALLLGVALLSPAASARAAELAIGQRAPDFTLMDEAGRTQRLTEYRGRTVVLMFYPKDFTSG